VILG
jgi:hypothetical protein